jgi:GGDEF domain-containing protein
MVKRVFKKEPFPLISGNQGLVSKDFLRFSKAFAEILLEKIVTADHLEFIFNEVQLRNKFFEEENIEELVNAFQFVLENSHQICKKDHFLFLPFDLSDESVVVAVFPKLDPLFLRRVTMDWLSEIRHEVKRSYLLLKQARIDDLTGLFNLSNLYSLLDGSAFTRDVLLLVVEIPGRSMTFQAATRHLHKCVESLKAINPEGSIVHHLGNSIFAIVTEYHKEREKNRLAASLVAGLKREGFKRVHVGTSCTADRNVNEGIGRNLLDEAWTALRMAKKRGPYGFGDYALLVHPEIHPLARPPEKLLRKLRRLWKKSEKFCLAHFRSDDSRFSAGEDLLPVIDRGVTVVHGTDLLVFLADERGKSALQWAEKVIKRYLEKFRANKEEVL